MRLLSAAACIAFSLVALPALAQEAAVPARQAVIGTGFDLPGHDLQSIFNTTRQACERACLADSQCHAFTFNSRAGACFPKTAAGKAAPYAGAYSAIVVDTPKPVAARAERRKAELGFLGPEDFAAAYAQARGLGGLYATGRRALAVRLLLVAPGAGSATTDPLRGAPYVAAASRAVASSGIWLDYAQSLRDASKSGNRGYMAPLALSAAINGYLRADTAASRSAALRAMARMLEAVGRGRDTIPALELAQKIAPSSATQALLDRAISHFGFRITDQTAESDSANPRICATFSRPLIKTFFDYAPYVQLPEPGLSVEARGAQICIGGVKHGQRYAVTFRAGLPAADGEKLIKPVRIALYVRDRAPSVSFPGRAYVLPRTAVAAVPVDTVNVKRLDLKLRRVSDRNILRAIQNGYFGQPLTNYDLQQFSSEVAQQVWSGTAEVRAVQNKDMVTRLPLEAAMKGLPAGIYALTAAIPGKDPYDFAPATQWLVISDLGITSYSGVDGLHVTVRSLADTSAKAGAKVTLVSRANIVLGTATTDANGNADFPAGLTRGTGSAAPGLVTVAEGAAQGGADFGFLSLADPPFDLSDRGVAGHEPAPPVDVFVTTDRGAYRAGETVHVTALARDGAARAIDGLPLTAKLTRPDGVEYTRVLARGAGAGGHSWDLPIGASAPRGPWKLDIYADPKAAPLASTGFLVADFLPERIDFSLKLPEGPVHLGDTPDLRVAAKYLFGAPGAGLSVEGEVRVSALGSLGGYPGYSFGRYDQPFSPQLESFANSYRTDAKGDLTIPLQLPQIESPTQPLQMTAVVRVAEGSGRPVERQVTKALTPSAPVIGIKPLFRDVVPENGKAGFDLVAVGPDAKPAAMKVHWVLNRLTTRYQWYQSYGNWNWTPMTTRQRVAEGTVDLTAAGPAQVSAPVKWGDYELSTESVGGSYAASSVEFYAGWYAPPDASSTPDTLQMSLDKPDYRPGETAMLKVVPRAAGTALISVLSNKLISRQVAEVKAGENLIPVKVTKDWGAGAYVTVSVVRPMDAKAGRNPARALGLAYAKVDPGDKQLAAKIVTAPEAEPRGPLDVAVRVAGVKPGETAYATIAAVDVGILNLTAFKAPDPSDHYFGQRKLGVGIRDVYGRLIDGLNGAMGTVRSGGDSGAGARMQAPPPTEKLVAFYSGIVKVGADGLAHAQFALPSFNGTVRVMAVVWSKTGVGQASKDVLVRDPVVVTASLPRFLAPGDRSRLLLEIVHAKGPAGHMPLDVSSDGVQIGPVPEAVDLAEHGKATLSIPITAEAAGLQVIHVALTTPDGKRLEKTLNLPVESLDPAVTRSAQFTLASGKSFSFDANVFDGLVPGTGKATVAVGPIARLDVPGLLAALNRYPYGCTEQITSRAMPLLYFQDVAQVMRLGTAKDLHKRVAEAITDVLTNQSSSGAFGLWGPSSGDLWLDSYVTDFLSRARAQGFKVPDVAFRSALDNLRNQINSAPEFDKNGGPYAYALMVLAREGAAAVGDLRYYADVKATAFDTPIASAQLGAALAAYGDQARADRMFARASRMVAEGRSTAGLFPVAYRADYGTSRRDAAAVLALAEEAGSKAVDVPALLADIAERKGAGYLSTQEESWTLLAAHALIERAGASGFSVNGAPVTGPLVRVVDDQTAAGQAVDIHNGSDRGAVVTVTTYGVPKVPGKAGGTGYAIKRSYYTLDGKPVDASRVKQGTRLVTVLDITPFDGADARLMVADPLPAGFEIDNPHLISSGNTDRFKWLNTKTDVAHSEFRQDRFLAAVGKNGTKKIELAYVVRAISPGSYHHPAASVEDMYRPDQRAHGATDVVTVTP
jgi:hypothetical protein